MAGERVGRPAVACAWGPGRLNSSGRDPLEALERVRKAAKTRTRSQVDDLDEAIVQIRHGRGVGVYVTRWITTHAGEVLEHEETTHGIAALSRLLSDTVRRSDAAQIVQDIRRTAAYRREVRAPHTVQSALRGPDERRREEAGVGMTPAWKLDRDDHEG